MPEVLSKHPDIVLNLLDSVAAIDCGSYAGRPRILTSCPQQQFCRLPDGELCVYAPEQFEAMTQLSAADLPLERRCSACGAIGHMRNNKRFHPRK